MIPKPDLDLALNELPRLTLSRVGDDADAGLVQVSLPHPPCPTLALGLGTGSTATLPLGQWPGEPDGSPRRVLLTADAPAGAPATLGLTDGATGAGEGELPTAEMVLWKQSDEPGYMWQNHYLKVSRGDRSIGLAMGLIYENELHWWEASRLVVLEETAFCRTVRMAGAIPVDKPSRARFSAYEQFAIPWLHKHNWLYGDVVLRLYANGVCEVMAHHINSMYVDIGGEFTNTVPVIGFVDPAGGALQDAVRTADDRVLSGPWTGDAERVSVLGVPMDITEAARLASEDQPGAWTVGDDPACVLWQPYMVSLFGGVNPMTNTGTPWHARPGEKRLPRGLARTVSWSMSLGERSPRVARYLAPYAWYGLMCELTPQPLLPVSNGFDARLESARSWIRAEIVRRGFEDGSVPRGVGTPDPTTGRSEPGWDGDVPYAQFLLAYGSQLADDYLSALRSAYHQTDVATDHSMHLVRMHGSPDGEYAQPMHRPLGTFMAYFETGDPYLLETGQAVVDRAWHLHRGAWPRLAIGRDASFIRGAVYLYRMTGDLHYRDLARTACHHVAEAQRENGSFGDQGGGAGIHQNGSFVTKPWMQCLGTSPVLDFLMLEPDHPKLTRCIQRLGDWLMAERWERDGVHGWSYQHDFMGLRRWPDIFGRPKDDLPTPGQWHDDHLGRILSYASSTTGDPAYLEAYFDSVATKPTVGGGHGVASTGVHCLWLQMTLANASLTADGPRVDPLPHRESYTGQTTVHTLG